MPFFVITGASGGGKSAILDELEQRGYQVQPEIGREAVKDQLANGGTALPWAEIFRKDQERQHDYLFPQKDYEVNKSAYEELDYELVFVPKAPISDRADFILNMISEHP